MANHTNRTVLRPDPVVPEVKRRCDVRRAKLYYLHDLSGKSACLKEKLDYVSTQTKGE